jgi:hypothetical protein
MTGFEVDIGPYKIRVDFEPHPGYKTNQAFLSIVFPVNTQNK